MHVRWINSVTLNGFLFNNACVMANIRIIRANKINVSVEITLSGAALHPVMKKGLVKLGT